VSYKDHVLAGIASGRPRIGPQTVHIDVTNTCNAKCITCWDHSPLLKNPRPNSWKQRRMSFANFEDIITQLAELGSIRAIILSGMGEPLTHPRIYDMIAAVKTQGWELTMLSNLVAADIDRLAASGIDQLLVGVQGVTPDSYSAFHPGWNEDQFFAMCGYLRRMTASGIRVRHVQVINRDTAAEVVAMVRFGHRYRADRVNFKLASLYGGTETCSITPAQRDWLIADGLPEAIALADALGVRTNLSLFSRQLCAAKEDIRATVPIETIGCYMGYAYSRITVDRDVLYCCNTEVRVGSLNEEGFGELWYGDRWNALRDSLAAGQWFKGCDKCGKLEQNAKWSERVRLASK
jgi:MoaA/NifB/PqqE/SkfB family radical SAM enzyme